MRVRFEGTGGSSSGSESTSAALLVDAVGLDFFAGAGRFRLAGLGGLGRARCIHSRSANTVFQVSIRVLQGIRDITHVL